MKSFIFVAVFTACWYWSSSINAVATQRLVGQLLGNDEQQGSDELTPTSLALLLTSSQLLAGGIISALFLCLTIRLGLHDGSGPSLRSSVVVGLLHYAGCLCTNTGFVYGSASLVQIIKLLEPIETLVLTVLVHAASAGRHGGVRDIGDVASPRKVAATLTIIGGTTLLLRNPSMAKDRRSIFAALASGACMSCRNVWKKSADAKDKGAGGDATSSHDTNTGTAVFLRGMISFSRITLFAALPALSLVLISMLVGTISLHAISPSVLKQSYTTCIQAVVFHCLYNIASITVLSLTSAPVHSLLNVGKRIANVLIVTLVFGEPLSATGKVGLALAAVGTALYNKSVRFGFPFPTNRIFAKSRFFILVSAMILFTALGFLRVL